MEECALNGRCLNSKLAFERRCAITSDAVRRLAVYFQSHTRVVNVVQ